MAVELSDAGLWLGERVLPADDVGREEFKLLCAAIGMFNLRKSRCAGLRSRLPSARMFGRVVPESVKAGSCGCLGGQPYVTHDTARQEGNQVTNLRRAPSWSTSFSVHFPHQTDRRPCIHTCRVNMTNQELCFDAAGASPGT